MKFLHDTSINFLCAFSFAIFVFIKYKKMKTLKFTFSAVLIVLSHFSFAQTGQWKLAGNSLTGTEKLGSKNNFPLNFITNNVTRMTLTTTGQLGIGTTAPEGNLHIFRGSAGL